MKIFLAFIILIILVQINARVRNSNGLMQSLKRNNFALRNGGSVVGVFLSSTCPSSLTSTYQFDSCFSNNAQEIDWSCIPGSFLSNGLTVGQCSYTAAQVQNQIVVVVDQTGYFSSPGATEVCAVSSGTFAGTASATPTLTCSAAGFCPGVNPVVTQCTPVTSGNLVYFANEDPSSFMGCTDGNNQCCSVQTNPSNCAPPTPTNPPTRGSSCPTPGGVCTQPVNVCPICPGDANLGFCAPHVSGGYGVCVPGQGFCVNCASDTDCDNQGYTGFVCLSVPGCNCPTFCFPPCGVNGASRDLKNSTLISIPLPLPRN